MAHIDPLPADAHPDLAGDFAIFEKILGFIPNSLLTMQRRPQIVRAFGVLTRAVMDPKGEVDSGFKRIIAHFASRAAGCRYCEAHALVAAGLNGIAEEKIREVWNYRTSPLYSEAERVALDFALAAGAVPNGVDDAVMTRMSEHWTEGQIVEILGAVCLYGFLNRWNDSMATDLEEAPRRLGESVLRSGGWSGGKHTRRGREPLSEPVPRADAGRCFVCGEWNPVGLRIRFHLDGDLCRGEFTPGENHVGYDGMTHGGILYSALDDVMANWLFLQGVRAYTARCEVRYRAPLPIGTRIRLEARRVKARRNLVVLEGKALTAEDDAVVAECQGRFLVAADPDAEV